MQFLCQKCKHYTLYNQPLQARLAEMAKTHAEAEKQTAVLEDGRGHHIGDFLPPEELNKFMNKYKVHYTQTMHVVIKIKHRKRWRVIDMCSSKTSAS